MAKKFIKNIQQLIDNTDPKRDLGNLSVNPATNFQFKSKNLVQSPKTEAEIIQPIETTNNIIWAKRSFTHDKGLFTILQISDLNTTIVGSKALEIVSNNGNFTDAIRNNNANVDYHAVVVIKEAFNAVIQINSTRPSSLAIFLRHEDATEVTRVYRSGFFSFSDSGSFLLPFSKAGTWHIDILYYHQTGPAKFGIRGDLGSFIDSSERPSGIVSLHISPIISSSFGNIGNRGFESVFIDGANGPTLANIIYWDRFSSSSSSGNDRGGIPIQGYGLYNVVRERLSFDVVSGWGTDAFVVSGTKLDNFPIASTLGIPGPIAVTYQVSGTQFDSGADRTIVTVSGTAFTGTKFDSIYIERVRRLQDIGHNPTDGEVISGTHFNVKAGDLYTYEIDTFNGLDRGLKSIRISGTAGDINPPGLVTSLAGTGSLKAIRLTWSNPTNIDLKGIHIWDTDTIVSGTTKPIKTIIKGSNTTIPECTVINEVSSGTLIDVWPYKLYASTYDHAGNESTEAMPTVTVTTDVDIKTSREGQRIETDTATNQLRFFSADGIESVRIGEDVETSNDGINILEGTIHVTSVNSARPIIRFANENSDTLGSELRFVKDGTSPADNDNVGQLTFFNEGTQILDIKTTASDVSSSNESAKLAIRLRMNGSFRDFFTMNGFNGTLDQGEIIFNNDARDIDYRIEAQGAVQAFEIEGSSGNVSIEKDLSVTGSINSTNGIKTKGITDADGDTRIQVEESADEDFIRFDTAGTQRVIISGANLGIDVDGPIERLHVRDLSSNHVAMILENEDARAGIELETQGATVNGEGILNFGIHTNRAITDKWTDPLGMWFRIDTRNSAQVFAWFTELAGSDTETALMSLEAGGDLGIGITNPTAQVHVDQSSTTAAQPVLLLDQADISEEMIEFNTTIGTGNAIEAIGAKTLTTTHFIKITIPGGLTRYIPCGTIA